MTSDTDPTQVSQRFYRAETDDVASGGRDFGPIAATLDPGCVLFQPASLPYGGEWRGHAGFEAWMQAFGDQWSALEVRDPELFPSNDVVISRSHVHAVARTSGRSLDWPPLQFVRIRNHRILELRPFHWDTADMLARMA